MKGPGVYAYISKHYDEKMAVLIWPSAIHPGVVKFVRVSARALEVVVWGIMGVRGWRDCRGFGLTPGCRIFARNSGKRSIEVV